VTGTRGQPTTYCSRAASTTATAAKPKDRVEAEPPWIGCWLVVTEEACFRKGKVVWAAWMDRYRVETGLVTNT